MTEQLPSRVCDICEQIDTDPRHVHGTEDGRTMYRHMDCCREAGCPTGVCNEVTSGAEDLRGGDLREHLMSLPEGTE